MTQNPPLSMLSVLWAAFLCFLFGANVVAIKIGLAGLGVFTSAGIRFALSAAAITVWAAATGRPFKVLRPHRLQLMTVCIIFTVQLSLFHLGISKTQASRGALIANMQPFFVLLLAHCFIAGDAMTVRKTVGILLGFGGVAFLFLDKNGIASQVQTGDFIILAAAFMWACNGVYTKRILDHFQPFQVVLYPMIFSSPVFFIEGLVWDGTMIGRLDIRVLGAMAYQSLVTAAFGFVAWNSLLKKYGAVGLHSFLFIMPIAGVLLGGLVLDEPISSRVLAALALIVAGILSIHFRQAGSTTAMPVGRNV